MTSQARRWFRALVLYAFGVSVAYGGLVGEVIAAKHWDWLIEGLIAAAITVPLWYLLFFKLWFDRREKPGDATVSKANS